MLIFKNNIYEPTESGMGELSPKPDPDYAKCFKPLKMLQRALEDEEELLAFIERQPREYWHEDFRKFYSYTHKAGNMTVIRSLLRIVKEGLECPSVWYHMNTYHFCFIFDALARFAFNYNHDNQTERLKCMPELRGKPIYFESFIKDYFFNTVFRMDEDKYNALTGEEKKKRGYTCPCQFAVINGLAPTREEMELKESKDYPYSIYV